jgi:GNAT superfamily N-acetyltransferase
MARRFQYDETFERTVRLADGTEAVVRMVRPEDKELLKQGFDKLSPESRFRRFFTAKLRLTEQELAYLTHVDGIDHFALGAIRTTRDGVEGLAIARFIRDADDPEVAEPALAVVDHAQGLGLGTLLLRHLTAAARERGIRRFHCELLAENVTMAHLLEAISPDLVLADEGDGVLEATLPLPEGGPDTAPSSVRDTALHRLLSYVARQAVSVPLGQRLLTYLKISSGE